MSDNGKIKVSASILSADLCNLERGMKNALAAGCEWIHFDVADGSFTHNITYGLPVLRACRKVLPSAFFDVHLMIEKPDSYAALFADAGADMITFHYEAPADTRKTIEIIHGKGKKAGIAVSPATPASNLYQFADIADMFLLMTVEPGYGGQPFDTRMTAKIRTFRDTLRSRGIHTPIEVDGGINGSTAPIVTAAGATVLVAGSYIFESPDMNAAVETLIRPV
jgi:ribulose-phosphate 3-epimerase